MQNMLPASLQLEVLRARPRHIGIQECTVRNLRHQRFGKARGPRGIVVFHDDGVGVTPRVRGHIVGAIVVHRPVQELQIAVGTIGVRIEEIRQVHLACAQLQSPRGNRGSQIQFVPVGFHSLARQWNDLAQHQLRKVRVILLWHALPHSHRIEVYKSRQSDCIADAVSCCVFDLGKDFGSLRELVSGIKRQQMCRCALRPVGQAVRSAVLGPERTVTLQNHVRLP